MRRGSFSIETHIFLSSTVIASLWSLSARMQHFNISGAVTELRILTFISSTSRIQPSRVHRHDLAFSGLRWEAEARRNRRPRKCWNPVQVQQLLPNGTGCWKVTGNPVTTLYGKVNRFSPVPPCRLTVRSESLPVTGAQVNRLVASVFPAARVRISSVELTVDVSSFSFDGE